MHVIDTVSCGMQTFIYSLIRRPDLWNRLREELEAARKQGNCETRVITYEDASKLPFLHACIMEALRIMPPVPSTLRPYSTFQYSLTLWQWACLESRPKVAL